MNQRVIAPNATGEEAFAVGSTQPQANQLRSTACQPPPCACGLATTKPHRHAAGLLVLLGALGFRRRERKRRTADRRSTL